MSIKIFPRAGLQVEGATAVEIDHANDSISLGDGTNLIEFLDPLSNGTWAIPVQPIGGGDASAANQTNGNQRTKITDGTDNAEIDDVGGEKALKVSVIASVGGGGGGTAATDSAAYTAGASQFTPIGGCYDDVSSDALAEGEMGMARLTSGRALHVAVQNTVPVSGTFWQATQPVSASSLPLPSGAATSANQSTIIGHLDGVETALAGIDTSVDALGTLLTTQAGYLDQLEGYLDGVETILTAIETAVEGTLAVNVQNASLAVTGTFWQATQPVSLASVPTHAVTQSGTWNIGSITTLPSIPAGSNNIGDVDVLTLPGITGNTAHDAAASGNPVLIAGRALSALPTEVASADTSYLMTDLAGRLVTQPLSPRQLVVRQATTISNTSETTILTAAASVYHDLCFLMITNTSDTAVRVDIRDDTAGSIIFSVGIAAYGGAVLPFPTPIPQGLTNDNWTAQASASVTDLRILAMAVKRS